MTRQEADKIVASLVKLRELATDEMSLQVPNLYPKWRTGVFYKTGERIVYEDVLYKVLQPHDSIEGWEPGVAASLFAKVLIPNENQTPEWEQPDSTNVYASGDKVSHNGKIWVSIIDNNSWEPGVFGWEEIE